jgi:hypothetical protein
MNLDGNSCEEFAEITNCVYYPLINDDETKMSSYDLEYFYKLSENQTFDFTEYPYPDLLILFLRVSPPIINIKNYHHVFRLANTEEAVKIINLLEKNKLSWSFDNYFHYVTSHEVSGSEFIVDRTDSYKIFSSIDLSKEEIYHKIIDCKNHSLWFVHQLLDFIPYNEYLPYCVRFRCHDRIVISQINNYEKMLEARIILTELFKLQIIYDVDIELFDLVWQKVLELNNLPLSQLTTFALDNNIPDETSHAISMQKLYLDEQFYLLNYPQLAFFNIYYPPAFLRLNYEEIFEILLKSTSIKIIKAILPLIPKQKWIKILRQRETLENRLFCSPNIHKLNLVLINTLSLVYSLKINYNWLEKNIQETPKKIQCVYCIRNNKNGNSCTHIKSCLNHKLIEKDQLLVKCKSIFKQHYYSLVEIGEWLVKNPCVICGRDLESEFYFR